MQTEEQAEYYSQLPYPSEPVNVPAVPTPNDPPWNSAQAFGTWFASVVLILVVPSVFLLPYLLVNRPDIFSPEGSGDVAQFAITDPYAVLLQLLAILPAHLLTLLLAWWVVTQRKHDFREMLGWASGPIRWWHYPIVLVVFFFVAMVVGSFFPEQENDMLRLLKTSRAAVFVVAFIATFTAPLVEEIIYRGLLYSAFQRSFGRAAAFVLVTLLFALVHVPQYWPSFSTIFLLTLLSVLLTSIRVVSENLWPCIVLHTLFNGLQSVVLIIEPYVSWQAVEPAVNFFCP